MTMSARFLRRLLPQKRRWWALAALLPVIAAVVLAYFFLPQVKQFAAHAFAAIRPAHQASTGHNHAGEKPGAHADADDGHAHAGEEDDHAHAGDKPDAAAEEEGHDHSGEKPGAHAAEEDGHDHAKQAAGATVPGHKHVEAEAVKLSKAAQQNVGMQLAKVELRPFERTMTVPGMVVERPGRSTIQIAAPLSGVVTRIWPLQGETVAPGQPVFSLRLTHEEVVEGQAQYLRTAEELDVVRREITRLEKVTADGAIAGKTLLERQYELQKLQGVFRAQRQGLLLHGLSNTQVDEIVAKRALVSEMTVFVPEKACGVNRPDSDCLLQIDELKVTEGQNVRAGDPLCVMSDHAVLYVQGKAFEQDATALNKAANNEWPVKAIVEASGQDRQAVPNLQIVYLANKVEPESRAFLFYVELPNQVLRNRVRPDGHRFTSWQFKPGQRVDLLVPVEQWKDRIVLPLNALVQEGPESYVFEENDGHFDRRTVRVEYRDQFSAVIANDGTLTPGKMVIASGSYQVHLAMKNKAGGAPDPHAGHNH
jgi:multidrug efflux pump subunit AcrA (membrane-fusion protein)